MKRLRQARKRKMARQHRNSKTTYYVAGNICLVVEGYTVVTVVPKDWVVRD